LDPECKDPYGSDFWPKLPNQRGQAWKGGGRSIVFLFAPVDQSDGRAPEIPEQTSARRKKKEQPFLKKEGIRVYSGSKESREIGGLVGAGAFWSFRKRKPRYRGPDN